METLYEIIKSKKSVSVKDERGNYLECKDGFIATKDIDIFFLRKNGVFVRDSYGLLGVFILSLFIGCLLSFFINILISPPIGNLNMLTFSIITLFIVLIICVIFYKSIDSYLIFYNIVDAEKYIDSKRKIKDVGVDGEIVSYKRIKE